MKGKKIYCSMEDTLAVYEYLKKEKVLIRTLNADEVLAKLAEEFSFPISWSTVRRILKQLNIKITAKSRSTDSSITKNATRVRWIAVADILEDIALHCGFSQQSEIWDRIDNVRKSANGNHAVFVNKDGSNG